jgi:hypothetical protein
MCRDSRCRVKQIRRRNRRQATRTVRLTVGEAAWQVVDRLDAPFGPVHGITRVWNCSSDMIEFLLVRGCRQYLADRRLIIRNRKQHASTRPSTHLLEDAYWGAENTGLGGCSVLHVWLRSERECPLRTPLCTVRGHTDQSPI